MSTLNDTIEKRYYGDLSTPSTSDAVTIACEDHFDIIGDLLSATCHYRKITLVNELQSKVYNSYVEAVRTGRV